MNKTLPLFVLVISSLILTSCMKISKKQRESKTDQVASTPEITPVSTPQIQIETQKKAALKLEYDITEESIEFYFPLSWPENIFVEIVDLEQRTTIPLNLNPDDKSWSFEWPSKDRKFGFIFRSQFDKKVEALKEIEVLPPLSLKTSQNLDLVATYGITANFEKIVFQRLELMKGAQIFLKTFSGQVIINELHSEFGTIQTFPSNDKANLGESGLSGGHVEFIIKKGDGNLSLVARGQHGGDGIEGPAPDEKLRGRQGESGQLAEFGNANYCDPSSLLCIISTYSCVKSPTDSSPGYQGLKGYRGNPGKDGGNSGLYFVSSSIPTVKINVISKEGKGGSGGAGGAGGEGGFGGEVGDGGLYDFYMGKFKYSKEQVFALRFNPIAFNPACTPAKIGQKGPQGPSGDFGPEGLDGINEILNSK